MYIYISLHCAYGWKTKHTVLLSHWLGLAYYFGLVSQMNIANDQTGAIQCLL